MASRYFFILTGLWRWQVGISSYLPAYENGTECSETSEYKIQTLWNYPEGRTQHTEHDLSLKSRINPIFVLVNCGFPIPLCVRITGYFIGMSLHNNMVQCFYYAINNWVTCFDPPGPSSGLLNNGINQGTCSKTTYGIPWFTAWLWPWRVETCSSVFSCIIKTLHHIV